MIPIQAFSLEMEHLRGKPEARPSVQSHPNSVSPKIKFHHLKMQISHKNRFCLECKVLRVGQMGHQRFFTWGCGPHHSVSYT